MTATELVMQPRGECRLASCPLASGGTACEQGHDDVIDCPEFEPADSAELGTEMSANLPEDGTAPLDVRGRNAITPADQAVEVYLGDGLTIKEATAVLQAGPATIVLPVGNVHVGKSTLIASLWEQICAGNAGGWSFAGSLTPYAFEDRCFLATLASGRDRAEQARTPDGTDRVFLHVAVVRNCSADDPPVLRELLLADVSGEHASNFVGADEPGPVRPLLHVADVIAVLVDGDRLADPVGRWSAINDARALARVIKERGATKPSAQVLAVVTKWDKCANVGDIAAAVNRLTTELQGIVPSLQVIKCAARSEDATVAEGQGVSDFLSASLREQGPTAPLPIPDLNSSRLIGSFRPGGRLLTRFVRGAE